MSDDVEIHDATPEDEAFLMSELAVRASKYGYRIAELEAQNAKLAAFAREIIDYAFDGRGADGASIQALAVHYGLLIATQYDPKRHGASFADVGADWFEYAGPLSAAREALAGEGE